MNTLWRNGLIFYLPWLFSIWGCGGSDPHRPSTGTKECGTCHSSAPLGTTHDSAFLTSGHGFKYLKNPTSCAHCHQPTGCANCHQNNPPAFHSKKFKKPGADLAALKEHIEKAAPRAEGCLYCHRDTFQKGCGECHLIEEGNRWSRATNR